MLLPLCGYDRYADEILEHNDLGVSKLRWFSNKKNSAPGCVGKPGAL